MDLEGAVLSSKYIYFGGICALIWLGSKVLGWTLQQGVFWIVSHIEDKIKKKTEKSEAEVNILPPLTQVFSQHTDLNHQFKILFSPCFVLWASDISHKHLLHFLLALREEKKTGSQCELDFMAEPG